jgi:hypothetical protein
VVRFAIAVTAVEFVLTAAAAVFLASSLEVEPFATEDDLRSLGLVCESHESLKRTRFEALFSYDSRCTLKDGADLSTSVRVGANRTDLDLRRRREEAWQAKPGYGRASFAEGSLEEEPGYSLRHVGPDGVRGEVVHLRGDRMLIVRVGRKAPFGDTPDEEVSRCLRRAHLVYDFMAAKLGWRD